MSKPEGHKINPDSHYCMQCGAHVSEILTEDLRCFAFENVLAMSHARWQQIKDKAAVHVG